MASWILPTAMRLNVWTFEPKKKILNYYCIYILFFFMKLWLDRKKFQSFQDRRLRVNEDEPSMLKKARLGGKFHEALLDRYCPNKYFHHGTRKSSPTLFSNVHRWKPLQFPLTSLCDACHDDVIFFCHYRRSKMKADRYCKWTVLGFFLFCFLEGGINKHVVPIRVLCII